MKEMGLMIKRLNAKEIIIGKVEEKTTEVSFKEENENWTNLRIVDYKAGKFGNVNVLCENRNIAAYVLKKLRSDVKDSKLMWVNDSELCRIFDNESYEDVINGENCGVYIWGKDFKSKFHLLKNNE